jgi:type IV pilus assembly protein PilV
MNASIQTSALHRARTFHGFTLVEVLAALVIMAVGMLGVAGLFVESLRMGQMSVAHTNAVGLAASFADRIRANPTAVDAYTGAVAGNAIAGTAANNCINGNADCSPNQMAGEDWFWWYEDVKAQLPTGREATVEVVENAPVSVYTIVLQWPERGLTTPASYTLTFSL